MELGINKAEADSPRGPNRFLYTACVAAVLIFSALVVGLELGADRFDPDEYNETRAIEQPLSEYLAAWPGRLSQRTQSWVFWRLSDGSLAGRRLPAALVGIAHTLAVVVLLRIFCPRHPSIALLGGTLLIFNAEMLRYSRWAFPNWIESTLCMTLYFFLLWEIVRRGSTRGLAIPAMVLAAITPLIYLPTLVPFAAGLAVVVTLRFFSATERTSSTFWSIVWDLRPFAVAIPAYAFQFANSVIKTGGARPTLLALYFPSSVYSQDLSGAIAYVWEGTTHVFWKLLSVSIFTTRTGHGIVSLVSDRTITEAVVALLVLGLVASLWRSREGVDAIFPLSILAAYWAAAVFFGLLGYYPFGHPRYALSMLVPALVVVGYGWVGVVSLLSRTVGALARRRSAEASGWLINTGYAVFLILLGVVGVSEARELHRHRSASAAAHRTIWQFGRDSGAELLLYEHDCIHWIKVRTPGLMTNSVDMLYTAGLWPRGEATPELAAKLRSGQYRTLLVCSKGTFTEERFPGYAPLLREGGYAPVRDAQAGIWRMAVWQAAPAGEGSASPTVER